MSPLVWMIKSAFVGASLLVLPALVGCQSPSRIVSDRFVFDPSIVDARAMEFEKHPHYLAMMTPYNSGIRRLVRDIEQKERVQLISRGEAHVTVVTPPEFDELKRAGVTIEDLNAIAIREKIQDSDLEAVCIGEGRAQIEGRAERTYFIVVKSKTLLKIRQEIERLAQARVGPKGQLKFIAAEFYPHITLGFTKRDLHAQQGVIKDEKSCRFYLRRESAALSEAPRD